MITLPNTPQARVQIDDTLSVAVNSFLPDDEHHIFNSPKFFALHSQGRSYYFQLYNVRKNQVLATIHFTETAKDYFRSPARGTFGGISTLGSLPIEIIESFLACIERILTEGSPCGIEIVIAPASHDQSLFSQVFNVLLRRGYSILANDLNQDIGIDTETLAEKMEYGNVKRLRKCVREGFHCAVLGRDAYSVAYDVIAANRKRRGVPISMTLEGVMEMVNCFPDHLKFFGVHRDDSIVASAICIKVRLDVLYVFYWGEIDGLQSYSPVVMLASFLYEFCRDAKLRLLDLGTSTLHGVPNRGLMRFKRSLGGRESLKITFTKAAAA